jgi:hypothetical protein
MNAGRKSRDVETLLNPEGIHLIPGEGGDRDGYILQVLFTLLRGYHDLFQLGLGDGWGDL